MELLAVVLMILGLFCMAGMNIMRSWLLKKKQALSPGESLISQNGLAVIFLATALIWWQDVGNIEFNARLFFSGLALTISAGLIIHFCVAESQKIGDLSLIAPIQALTPGLITLTALFIGEYPGRLGIMGIIFVSVGIFVHTRENATSLKEYLQPFIFLKLPSNFQQLDKEKQKKAHIRRRALVFAYISAIFGTFGLLGDSIVSRNGNVAFGFLIYSIALTFFYLLLYKFKKDKSLGPLNLRLKKFWPRILFQGFLWSMHIIFIMSAFRLAQVAYIGTLKRFNILLVVALSYPLLGETMAKKRLWPAFIITIGAVLLALDPAASKVVINIEKIFK